MNQQATTEGSSEPTPAKSNDSAGPSAGSSDGPSATGDPPPPGGTLATHPGCLPPRSSAIAECHALIRICADKSTLCKKRVATAFFRTTGSREVKPRAPGLMSCSPMRGRETRSWSRRWTVSGGIRGICLHSWTTFTNVKSRFASHPHHGCGYGDPGRTARNDRHGRAGLDGESSSGGARAFRA
jgi:hypothetical protein